MRVATFVVVMRAYRLPTTANKGKLEAVAAILPFWQRGLVHVQYLQVCKLKSGITTLGWLDGPEISALPSYLSRRQWKSVVNQVNMALQAWQECAKSGIRAMISALVIEDDVRADLYRINAHAAWWSRSTVVERDRGEFVSPGAMSVAAELANAWVRGHPFPNLSKVRTMLMDGQVATVSVGEGSHADYWVKVATLVKRRPVNIPLHSYDYFACAPGDIRNHCQVTVGRSGDVSFTLVKKSTPVERRVRGSSLGLDWGMKNVFTTSDGRVLGCEIHAWLCERDSELATLAASLQRQGIRPRDSRRYRRLNHRIREYVHNEVNRVLNRLAAGDIRQLVVEALDFRMSGLSARLNRMLTRAGRAAVRAKLAALQETHGIAVAEVNPAYTSQACSACGYVDKRNRTSQARFTCRFCGRKLQADINAARNILGRSGAESGYRSLPKEAVLARMDRDFHARWRVNPTRLRERHRRGGSTATPFETASNEPDSPVSDHEEGPSFQQVTPRAMLHAVLNRCQDVCIGSATAPFSGWIWL